jgi:protein-glutamine gamma-glutamyltransferase
MAKAQAANHQALQARAGRAPTATAQAPVRVERFFEFSLVGLVAMGYFAVLSSGYLDAPTAILTACGLVLRLLMTAGLVRLEIGPRWVAVATLAYIGFYPIDYQYISRDFVTATVHMVFFLAVLRVLTAKSNRDYFFVKVIAFVELMAATLLSSNVGFFVSLAFFLLFGVATFASSEIRRSSQRAARVARTVEPRYQGRLTALSLYTAFGILILTAGLFFLLPRTARAAFRHVIPSRYHLPGFSGELTLGQIGAIQQSDTPVMHIKPDQGSNLENLKWRGAALTDFDGRRWTSPGSLADMELLRVPKSSVVRLANTKQQWRKGRQVGYEVVIRNVGADALFLAGVPEYLSIHVPSVFRSFPQAYRTGLGVSDGLRYTAYSYLDPQGTAATFEDQPLGPYESRRYLRLPSLDKRIAELAQRLTKDAQSPFDKASLIERYLRRNFGYTLELLDREHPDPLAHFLFERRKGHCEYFASAMAVMLRSQGIPARIATGFQSGTFNPMSGWYLIRAADAHSWVEAFFPGQGWLTFDPTPPDNRPQGAAMFSRVALMFDAIETFWADWVLNYNLDRQLNLAASVEGSGDRLRMLSLSKWLDQSKLFVKRAGEDAMRFGPGVVVCLIGLALLVWQGPAVWKGLHQSHHERRIRRGQVRQSDAALLYQRMLRTLQRRGLSKPAWLTPREFAGKVLDPVYAGPVQRFTDAYYELRYSQAPEAAQQALAALAEIENSRRSVRTP